jgi:hypothetical protein
MQSRTLEQLYKERFSAYQSAAQAPAQAISEVHSNVYRLFTWIQNLKPEQVERTTAQQKKKVDEIAATLETLARLQLEDEDRRLIQDASARLAKYRDSMLKAIDLSTVDVSIGAMQMQNADAAFQDMVRVFAQLVQRQEAHAQSAYERGRRRLRPGGAGAGAAERAGPGDLRAGVDLHEPEASCGRCRRRSRTPGASPAAT